MAVIQGTEVADNLVGTDANDQIHGRGGNDVIDAGEGDDTLHGGAGADHFIGGAGTDTVSYSDATAAVTLNFKTGVHTGIAAGDTFEGIEVIGGSRFADTFISNAAAHNFVGGAGDTLNYAGSTGAVTLTVEREGGSGQGGDAEGDTFTGMATLVGSSFNDTFTLNVAGTSTVRGGEGNDVYVLNSAATVVEDADAGVDEVRTSLATYTLTTNVENLTYTGTANFTGRGNASDNVIVGGVGNDTLYGGAGADRFIGGSGTDTVSYTDANAAVTLNFKTGVHTGIAAGDTFNSIEVIGGSRFADTFISNATAHNFVGGAGDTLNYAGSTAAVALTLEREGGSGQGGDAEGDTFTSMATLVGSSFNDTFTLNVAGTSTVRGGEGNDVYVLNSAATVVEDADAGVDEVRTSLATYTMTANVENLTYTGTTNFTGRGNASDNVIVGGVGNDTLYGGAGADRFIGGSGTDTVSYTDATAAVTLNFKTGVHTGIAAGDTFNSIEVIGGSRFADTFISNATAHNFVGGAGDTLNYAGSTAAVALTLEREGGSGQGGDAEGDTFTSMATLVGSSFNDTFTLNVAGTSTVRGGEGDDVYVLNSAASVVEVADQGFDEVRTSLATYTMTANVENLTYTGTANFTGRGNASDNVIVGGVGNDTLSGDAGADRFVGGAGADTINGGADSDAVWYLASTAGVSVDLAAGTGVGGDAQGDVLTLIENLAGSAHADVLSGDAAANTLFGASGDDLINGGAGNDILYGDGIYHLDFGAAPHPANNAVAQADVINGGAGDDLIFGAESNDTGSILRGNAGNDFIMTANGSAYGDEGNDRLIGNGSNYELHGGAGADRLEMTGAGRAFGGEGGDIYTVSSSRGVIIEDTGSAGLDRVVFKHIETQDDIFLQIDGANLNVYSIAAWSNGDVGAAVVLNNWFAGSSTIESFQTNNGDTFSLAIS